MLRLLSDADLSFVSADSKLQRSLRARRRDLFRRPFLPQELTRIDAVVFDPPRQGADAQARALAASKVPVIASVSCNAATFARDTKILLDPLATTTPKGAIPTAISRTT